MCRVYLFQDLHGDVWLSSCLAHSVVISTRHPFSQSFTWEMQISDAANSRHAKPNMVAPDQIWSILTTKAVILHIES